MQSVAVEYPPFLTASAVDRFLSCNGSALLPIVAQGGAVADAGTAAHAELLQPGHLPAAALAWFGGVDPLYEAALGADAETDATQFFGVNRNRSYPCPGPAWIAGTIDAVQIAGRVLSVGDLKTGYGQAHGSLPAPQDSGQLLCYAWLAWLGRRARVPGWRPQRVRLAWFVEHGARSEVEDAEVHPDDLGAWGDALAARVRMARAGAVPRLARGPQCGMCPSFDACPAQGDAIRRVADLRRTGAPLQPAELAAAFRDLEDAERACETARAALTARVGSDEVPVGQTHVLKTIRAEVARIDVGAAVNVLGERAQACLTVSLTQEGLRRGLGRHDVSDVMRELDEGGAVTKVPAAPYLKLVRRRFARQK